MNVILKGKADQILENMVAEGRVNTKSEAIRLAIFVFDEKQKEEDRLVAAKLDRIDAEVKAGKRRTLSMDEALGPYAKYLKKKK